MTSCRYHCRACGGHFTSLEAFDAHTPGAGGCEWPDGARLIEIPAGVCRIAEGVPSLAVTIYAVERAARAAEYFGTTEGRQALSANGKSVVA